MDSVGFPVPSSASISHLPPPSSHCRSWCPCEIALSASQTVASTTSKESHDLYACRGARPLPGILRSPEEQPAGRAPAPPHSPAVPDPAPAAVWRPRPAPPLHHRLPPHAPLRLQDDRGAEQNAGHDHAEAGKVTGGKGLAQRVGSVGRVEDPTVTKGCEGQGKGSSPLGRKKSESNIRPKTDC